jgi:hypothetical protein
MRLIKTLGLAALVALMAMVVFGATSATAEPIFLCGEDAEECASTATHVHETTLSGHKAVLKTNLITIECDVLLLGDTVAETEAPLVIEGNFTYSNCGTGCKVTEENGPSEIEVLREGHETASVTGEFLIHAECTINCRYNGVGLKATAKGPLLATETNGEVSLKEQVMSKESGTFCPSTSKLTITTTPLSATYFAKSVAPPLHIESCMTEEGTNCKTATVGTTFEETTAAIVFKGEGEGEEPPNAECSATTNGKITDATSEKAGDEMEVSITKVSLSECTGATVTAGGLPWSAGADIPAFKVDGKFEYRAYLVTDGNCAFQVSPTDRLFYEWDAGTRRWLDLGELKVQPLQPAGCFRLMDVEATLRSVSISDPNLPEALSLAVN